MNTTQLEIGGRTLTVETGHVAQQASGAVTVRMGDTMLLVTAVMAATPREGIDFFPLTCDYEEKLYAAGKIPGGFIRREGRPSEQAILNSRLIDRPIRPLFPKDFRNDVQVVATVLSVDQDADPATMAINGAYLGGGMWIAPKAEVNDGLFEVVTIGDVSRWLGIRSLPMLYRGTHGRLAQVEFGTARRVEIDSEEPIGVEADGELAGNTPAVFEMVPAALQVIDWRPSGILTRDARVSE